MHTDRRGSPLTHHSWLEINIGGRWEIVQALCGESIRIEENALKPTCPVCKEKLANWDARDPYEEVGLP